MRSVLNVPLPCRLDTAESNDNGGLDIARTADIGNSQYLEEDHTQAHEKLMTIEMCAEEAHL